MPFTNLDNRHFNAAAKTSVEKAIDDLELALTDKLANLSAEERQKYGSVNEQNKLIINKVKDYYDSQPSLSSGDIDWVEFANDHDTRAFLQNTIQRLQTIINGMENAKILHDFDNYTDALTDYEYSKYKANTKAIGYQPKVDELKQFFTGGATNPPKA